MVNDTLDDNDIDAISEEEFDRLYGIPDAEEHSAYIASFLKELEFESLEDKRMQDIDGIWELRSELGGGGRRYTFSRFRGGITFNARGWTAAGTCRFKVHGRNSWDRRTTWSLKYTSATDELIWKGDNWTRTHYNVSTSNDLSVSADADASTLILVTNVNLRLGVHLLHGSNLVIV